MSRRSSDALIPMAVVSLTVDPVTSLPAVMLRDEASGRGVSIAIGLGEATAIAAEIGKIETERPMTHHLLSTILERAGVRVDGIEIHSERGDRGDCTPSQRAVIRLRMPGGDRITQDARPSDALALALRANAPVWIAPSVIDQRERGRVGAGVLQKKRARSEDGELDDAVTTPAWRGRLH
jgi:bifunctional DNase/RNase